MIGIGDKWEQPLHNAHEVQSSYGKPSWARLSDSDGGAWKRHTYREWQVTVERTRPTVRTWLGDSPGEGEALSYPVRKTAPRSARFTRSGG